MSDKAEGKKNDGEKTRFDLIPAKPFYEVAQVLTDGADLYGERNWEKGLTWGRCFAATMRHMWKWWGGEKIDPKDGHSHLAHAIANILFLREYEDTHKELDDRPRKCLRSGTYPCAKDI